MPRTYFLEFAIFFLMGTHWVGARENMTLIRGFPTSITCGAEPEYPEYHYFGDSESGGNANEEDLVECVLSDENETLFNKTIVWKDVLKEGYFFDASDEWHNRKVNKNLTWRDLSTSNFEYTVILKEHKPELEERSSYLMDDIINIGCFVPKELRYISEEQFNNITHTWYKDNEKIEKNDTRFDELQANYLSKYLGMLQGNATYETYPGEYTCFAEYNGRTLTALWWRVCVKGEMKNPVQILPSQEAYVVAPGESLTVSCIGNIGSELRRETRWEDGKGDEICSARLNENEAGSKCHANFFDGKFCEPATEEKILEESKHDPGDFKMTLDFHDLAFSDSGIYHCIYKNYLKKKSANFTITVRDPPKDWKLLTGLMVIIAIILIATILICICAKDHIRYLYKKYFGKLIETDRTVVYLVYEADVFSENRDKNPLRYVRNWLDSQKYTYHDPNDGRLYNDAGENAIEHSKNVVARCLSMIVFLTPQLLNENNMELLKATKTGFHNNIGRDFPIVFIYDEKMKATIELGRKCNDPESQLLKKTFVTVRYFMKRNTVITWNAKDQVRLHRLLYVALPKVRVMQKRQNDDGAEETLL